jgi:2-isopropylmalate synthase
VTATSSTDVPRVRIFDTTLRDGEQSPGISLSPEGKLEIARQLERLGVDVIEAGFAIASPLEVEAIRLIAQHVRMPTIASLCRTNREDIDAGWRAVQDAAHPRLHVFIATSPIHMEHKLRMAPDDVVREAAAAVAYARSFGVEVEFSCEDATRSDPAFLARVVCAAIEAGATVINLPDTVGYVQPDEYAAMFRQIQEDVPELRGLQLSAHCHDDLGLATANSIAAVEAGATQVECCINGIGERAGNASLEEIVMLLHTRKARYERETGIQTREIARTSRLVSRMSGYAVAPNKAIVGRNAFAHEAGIHQDGVLKHKRTYEIMDAETVGLTGSDLVLGKHSGRHALRKALSELGYELNDEELRAAFGRFKAIAERKSAISALDLEAIVGEGLRARDDRFSLAALEISTRTGRAAWARVEIIVTGEEDARIGAAEGDGPIDAALHAVGAAIEPGVELSEYEIHAVTEGTDALGEVRLAVTDASGTSFAGQAVAPDIAEASVRAFLRACSHAHAGRATITTSSVMEAV